MELDNENYENKKEQPQSIFPIGQNQIVELVR
jgi:hypothetical protein